MAEISRHNTDGRIARGERTREAIVAAHTALLREGVLKPTGKLIAERAGISVRTLWLNFKDLEAVMTASVSYWLAADAELRRPIDGSLPLDRRIAEFVQQRVEQLEHLAPAARSAALGEPFSPALQASRRAHVERLTADLRRVFSDRLDASAGSEDATLLHLYVVTSWPSWAILRDDLGLDVDAAAAVMQQSVRAALAD
jgi:TetR/AcrR family transcriptional regulator of autoinduction and epiphytic fitness